MATSLHARRRRQRARDALAAYTKRAGPSGTDGAFWMSSRVASLYGNELRQPYRQHTWVYAAASWIAQNLASVPFMLYTGAEDSPDEVLAGPWYDLFSRPNPELTGREFWEISWLLLLLPPGEVFWLLQTETGDLVSPGQPPRWMWPYTGKLFDPIMEGAGIAGWKMRLPNGETVNLEPHQVIHHRIPNPYDPRRGQSPIEAAWRGVRTDVKAQDWNESVLDNGGEPGTVIKLPGATAEQAKAFKTQWQDRHGGSGNAGKIAVLNHEKADILRASFTHVEMGFQAMREWSRQEVATAYKLPLFVLSVLGDVHRETSREALKLAWESGCVPHARRAEAVLDGQLFRGREGAGKQMAGVSDNAVWGAFDFSVVNALQRDENERRELAVRDRDLGFTRNAVNARHELGYDTDEPEPDGSKVGDVALVPIALQPLRDAEMSLDLSFEDEEEEPAGEVPPEFGGGDDDDEDMDDEGGAGSEAKDEEDPERAARQRRIARDLSWRQYIQHVHGPAETRMTRKISRYFYLRRGEVLRKLNDMRSAEGRERAITEAEFETWLDSQRARWDTLLAEDTRPATEMAIESSYDRLSAQLGKPIGIGMSSPETLRLVEELGARKGRFVNKTMSDILKDQLREALTGDPETMADITKRIKRVFGALQTSQARTIARTEVGAATSQANVVAYAEEGITRHSWLTARDDKVRDSHQIDGETVDVGKPFSNGLEYPLDPSGSGEDVINCRCTTLPEV